MAAAPAWLAHPGPTFTSQPPLSVGRSDSKTLATRTRRVSTDAALMVEQGMTPMQAIVAVTKTAAQCARVEKLVGTLEVGKRADLIAVEGDPLSRIAVLQDREKIRLVLKDGAIAKETMS